MDESPISPEDFPVQHAIPIMLGTLNRQYRVRELGKEDLSSKKAHITYSFLFSRMLRMGFWI